MKKFKKGDRAFLNEKCPSWVTSTYKIVPGDEVKITSSGNYNSDYQIQKGNGTHFIIKSSCLDKAPAQTTSEQFASQMKAQRNIISAATLKLEDLNARVAFLKETGSDAFKENEYKAYCTLSIIEKGNLSKLEKAQAIAALIG